MPPARPRPVLLYDGDCGFCARCAAFQQRRVRADADTLPWQHADLPALGVTTARADHELLWITPPGTVYGGADAIARLLLRAGGPWAVLGALLTLPALRPFARAAYRLVATLRPHLPGSTGTCGRDAGGEQG